MKPKFAVPFKNDSTFFYPTLKKGHIEPLNESYHAVYTDGHYIYDGALHLDGIPINDYIKLIKSMNSGGISFRQYNPNNLELNKG